MPKPLYNRVVKSPFTTRANGNGQKSTALKTAKPQNAIFVGKYEITPSEERRILLGSYVDTNPPKGFLVELGSDTKPVATDVTSQASTERIMYFLQITNQSDEPVNAEIWRL